MMNGFFGQLGDLVAAIRPDSVLDAGCGEGETIERLRPVLPCRVAAFDINPESVRFAASRLDRVAFSVQDIHQLDYPDASFDLVICSEVLEHLEEPLRALQELRRVARRKVIVTVPFEPWFRIGNLLRGKYLRRLGNHPEHCQLWNRRTLGRLVAPMFASVEVRTAFPWLIALCSTAER